MHIFFRQHLADISNELQAAVGADVEWPPAVLHPGQDLALQVVDDGRARDGNTKANSKATRNCQNTGEKIQWESWLLRSPATRRSIQPCKSHSNCCTCTCEGVILNRVSRTRVARGRSHCKTCPRRWERRAMALA